MIYATQKTPMRPPTSTYSSTPVVPHIDLQNGGQINDMNMSDLNDMSF